MFSACADLYAIEPGRREMTKAGERMIEGVKEAVAVARGEQPAASITVAGHTYVPKNDVAAAIRVVQDYLTSEYIVEECSGQMAFGCASCQAIMLRHELDVLLNEVDGATVRHAPTPPSASPDAD